MLFDVTSIRPFFSNSDIESQEHDIFRLSLRLHPGSESSSDLEWAAWLCIATTVANSSSVRSAQAAFSQLGHLSCAVPRDPSEMAHGTLLVLGSGPGIGVHVAQLFAERGFQQVILASRDAARLKKEVEDVKKAGGEGVSRSLRRTLRFAY